MDTLQRITIGSNETVVFSFHWSDPHFSVSGAPGAAGDLDILLYSDRNRPTLLAGGVGNNLDGDPVEVFAFTNYGPAETFLLGIELYAGPAPATIEYVYYGDVTINEHDTFSSTLDGHANAAGARAMGAARYDRTPVLEAFSSSGGTPLLFSSSGSPVYQLRQKPEIVAPDGGDTTFSYPGQDYEGNGLPNFFGTSAAAPHAAGVAALLRELDPAIGPDGIYNALQSSALDMGPAGVDFDSGYGLIQADAALATRAVLGLITLDSGQLARGNVAPLVDGEPQPDDAFNSADLLLIRRKTLDPTLY